MSRGTVVGSVRSTARCTLRQAGGAAFGRLVHAVLADVPLDASRQMVANATERHGRALAATDDEVREAAAIASRALEHDLFTRARAAAARGRCRRESPVAHLL